MVTQHDKGGERTVGVVTKCDLSQTPEDVSLSEFSFVFGADG